MGGRTAMRRLAIIVACLCLSGFRTEDRRSTIYLIGDSTMANKLAEKRPETGWGEPFAMMFDSTVVVDNRAKNGRSTRTFLSEGLWQLVMDSLKQGDVVFIQFGHNDESKEKTDRYTPPEDFKKNLAKFVQETRSKGASPILLTPIVRRRFDSVGVFYDVHGVYPSLTREVASALRVPLIDLHCESERLLKELGEEQSKKLFLILAQGESPNYPQGLQDNTHFTPFGAETWAHFVAMQSQKIDLSISQHVLNKESTRQ